MFCAFFGLSYHSNPLIEEKIAQNGQAKPKGLPDGVQRYAERCRVVRLVHFIKAQEVIRGVLRLT